MDTLISFLCLGTLFVPTAAGVGITLFAERFIGVRAYWVGWLLPLILLVGLYAADALWTWSTPCEPADSLECGEPAAYTLILFIALLGLTAIANAIAQMALFWLWGRGCGGKDGRCRNKGKGLVSQVLAL